MARTVVEVLYDSGHLDIQALLSESMDAMLLPREEEYLYACRMEGKTSILVWPKCSLSGVLGRCLMQVYSDRRDEKKAKELFDLYTAATFAGKMCEAMSRAVPSGREPSKGITPKIFEDLMTHLYNVQKHTSPWAIPPQSEDGDRILRDMERYKDVFAGGLLIKE